MNFAGRVLVEGRRAEWRKKGWETVSRELQGRVPGAGRNGTSKVATSVGTQWQWALDGRLALAWWESYADTYFLGLWEIIVGEW